MKKAEIKLGSKHHRLTALHFKDKRLYVMCECGKVKAIRHPHWGTVKSCGCLTLDANKMSHSKFAKLPSVRETAHAV